MYTLIFYHQPEITHTMMAIMAALTMLLGGIGAIAQWDIRKILGYNVIIGVGFIVSGLAVFTSSAVLGGCILFNSRYGSKITVIFTGWNNY